MNPKWITLLVRLLIIVVSTAMQKAVGGAQLAGRVMRKPFVGLSTSALTSGDVRTNSSKGDASQKEVG
jgi:hypothetical protein